MTRGGRKERGGQRAAGEISGPCERRADGSARALLFGTSNVGGERRNINTRLPVQSRFSGAAQRPSGVCV
ncbi:unnamed protein product [Lampetra planeri]